MPDFPSLYLDLAYKRATTCFPGYRQPEEFGYDFKDWVSPYTKTAHALDGIAVVLQDWSSEEKLSQGVIPAIQEYGRDPDLKTNKMLDRLLREVLCLSIGETYATNIFPFIKPGGISSPIPLVDVIRAAREFAVPELRLARPYKILALGGMPSAALKKLGSIS